MTKQPEEAPVPDERQLGPRCETCHARLRVTSTLSTPRTVLRFRKCENELCSRTYKTVESIG